MSKYRTEWTSEELERLKFHPHGGNILIEMLDENTTVTVEGGGKIEGRVTEGKIFIPKSSVAVPQQAVVLAVGPGLRSQTGELIPVSVAVGDHIVIQKHAQMEMNNIGKSTWRIISEHDVLGVLELPAEEKSVKKGKAKVKKTAAPKKAVDEKCKTKKKK